MRLNHNQRMLLWNGGLWAAFNGLTGYFLIAYAVALDASNIIVGLLGAMPFIAQLISEFPGAKAAEYFSRLKLTITFSLLSRLSWIIILAAPYLFEKNPLIGLVVGYFLARVFALFTDPSWTSLMADIVPSRIRGRFFAHRNRILALAGLMMSVLGGFYLNLWPKESMFGFGTMFAFGLLFGIANVLAASYVKEPKNRDHNHHALKEFFKVDGHFRLLCITAALFNFAVMFASPFFAVYMLRNLNLSYSLYALAGALATIVKIISFNPLGKLADRTGDKPVALLCITGTALVPLSFIFVTPEMLWLLVPAQIISGIAWAGTDLTLFNFLLSYSSSKKRPLQIAEYRFINAIPMIIAPLLGGLVADKGALLITGIPLVFAISSAMRFMTVSLFAQLPSKRGDRKMSVMQMIHTARELTQHRGHQEQVHALESKLLKGRQGRE